MKLLKDLEIENLLINIIDKQSKERVSNGVGMKLYIYETENQFSVKIKTKQLMLTGLRGLRMFLNTMSWNPMFIDVIHWNKNGHPYISETIEEKTKVLETIKNKYLC